MHVKVKTHAKHLTTLAKALPHVKPQVIVAKGKASAKDMG